MIYEIQESEKVSNLFKDWEATMVWSCLQGIMGKIYSNELNFPLSAMAVLGDFIFFAGRPCKELVCYKPDYFKKNFAIMIPQNDEWKDMICDIYRHRARTVFRYATKKESNSFDKNKLNAAIVSIPVDYELREINGSLYDICLSESWSSDLVSQFSSYDKYKRLGLGYVILKNNIVVSGASSYSRYRDGIEIQIDTRKEYRKKGLAYACGSKLISECLNRNLYPSWDSHNKESLSLALKLGYEFSYRYTAIEVYDY